MNAKDAHECKGGHIEKPPKFPTPHKKEGRGEVFWYPKVAHFHKADFRLHD